MLYRATPTSLGHSPTQLLTNWQISIIPSVSLDNYVPNKKILRRSREKYCQQMECQFDRSHKPTALSELEPDTRVYVDDIDRNAIVIRKRKKLRLYDIELTNSSVDCRNRKNLCCPRNRATSFQNALMNILKFSTTKILCRNVELTNPHISIRETSDFIHD